MWVREDGVAMTKAERQKKMEQALDLWQASLTRYVFRITRNVESAQDVVQDVFLKLWQVDDRVFQTDLKPWLFTVCRNKAIDLLRRKKPASGFELDEFASADFGPEIHLVGKQTSEQVYVALAKLSPRQQELLRLRCEEGFSYQEMATITGLTANNIAVQVHGALKKIREWLADESLSKEKVS